MDDYPDGIFASSGDKLSDNLDSEYPSADYGNLGPLDRKKRANCFSVVIETTSRISFSFFDEDFFYDTGDAFYDSRTKVFDADVAQILKFLIKQKTDANSGFRLLIKGFADASIGDEQAQQADLNAV